MVDPHDNRTMELPLAMLHARAALLAYLEYREAVKNPVALRHVEPSGRRLLAGLGGLASPW